MFLGSPERPLAASGMFWESREICPTLSGVFSRNQEACSTRSDKVLGSLKKRPTTSTRFSGSAEKHSTWSSEFVWTGIYGPQGRGSRVQDCRTGAIACRRLPKRAAVAINKRLSVRFKELLERQLRESGHATFPPNFCVVGNREGGAGSLFNQDNVAATLARDLPIKLFKCTDDFASAHEGNLRHLNCDFYLRRFESERHAALGANFEAKRDRFLDIFHRLFATRMPSSSRSITVGNFMCYKA
jgi:hypothetical protein